MGSTERYPASARRTLLQRPGPSCDRHDTFRTGALLAWDAFMLFDADATFATAAEHLETSRRTIIGDHAKLEDALT